jgi:hypothetical protein
LREGNKIEQIKDENGRLFVFLHMNKEDQNEFINEAITAGCFAQSIPFMVRQAGEDLISKKLYHNDKEITDIEGMLNGVRPYLTISNVSPDSGLSYYNWTFLESIIESGWKRQF